jgi:hypothetical protein
MPPRLAFPRLPFAAMASSFRIEQTFHSFGRTNRHCD